MAKYRYNDKYKNLLLPGLPETWNQEKYPHAIIVYLFGTLDCVLLCSDEPYFAITVDEKYRIAVPADTNLYGQAARVLGDAWEGSATAYLGMEKNLLGYYLNDKVDWVWTYKDICDDAGNVIYAATEPVLVPEEEEEAVAILPDKLGTFKKGLLLGLTGKPLPLKEGGIS